MAEVQKEAGTSSGSLARNAGRFGAATLLSRVLGLMREQLFAVLVGAGPFADAFVIAFRIPNLLRDLFAEGALSAAFVPTYTAALRNDSKEAAFLLANRITATLTVVLGVLVLIGEAGAEQLVGLLAGQFPDEMLPYTANLTRIMLPFLPLVSFAAVAMGMLTSQGTFGIPALASTMFNVSSIAVGAALWLSGASPRTAAIGWSIGTLLGGAAQFLIQVPPLIRAGWRPRWVPDLRLQDPGVRRVALLMVPATLGLAATQLNIVVNTYFASGIRGAPAWLAYAFRLMQLPLGVFGVAIATVSMTSVAQRAAAKDLAGIDVELGRALRMVAFLTIPCIALFAAAGVPIVRLLFEYGRFTARDTEATAAALAAYAVGLYAYSAVKVLAPTFYALNRPRIPLAASVGAVAANLALNVAFLTHGFWVLALGTSAAALTNFFILTWGYRRVGGNWGAQGLVGHFLRVAAASAAAGGLTFAASEALRTAFADSTRWTRVLEVGLLGGGFVLVYAALAALLRVTELDAFRRILRRRLGRSERPPTGA